jgi:hypothetical protein
MRGNEAASVYPIEVPSVPAEEPDVVTPRETRSTDVSRISLTAPMAASLAVAVAVVVGAFWQIRGSDNAELNPRRCPKSSTTRSRGFS